jgi:hypothetical protein
MFRQAVDALFRKDASGRTIFLPRGPRKPGYYVDSPSDEQKIRALVKLKVAATIFFNLGGFLVSYALAASWNALYFTHLPISIEARALRTGAVYVISALVIQFTPILVIQKMYQRSLREICQNLQPVEPGVLAQLGDVWKPYRQRVLLALAVGLLLMGVVFAAVARRQIRKPRAAPNATCPPAQATP